MSRPTRGLQLAANLSNDSTVADVENHCFCIGRDSGYQCRGEFSPLNTPQLRGVVYSFSRLVDPRPDIFIGRQIGLRQKMVPGGFRDSSACNVRAMAAKTGTTGSIANDGY